MNVVRKMRIVTPHIDPYLFDRQLEAFRAFGADEESGVPFASFAYYPYTDKQEGYRYEICRAGRDALAFQA